MDHLIIRPRVRLLILTLLVFQLILTARGADSVVVFNEIMYHPATNETELEWVELYNPLAVDVDLSGWSISGGIQYPFSEGTLIPGRSFLVVARNPQSLGRIMNVTNMVGPFTGRLSNSGDTLELRDNNSRLMDQVSYGVDEDWPVGPDGSGVSLAKKDENSASKPAVNWIMSASIGGTPGRPNFSKKSFEVLQSIPVPLQSVWRYQPAEKETNDQWRLPAFDDTRWSSGFGLFRSGDVLPPVGEMKQIPTVYSSGTATDRSVLSPGSSDPHYWLTQAAQSPVGSTASAIVIENHPAWAANDTKSSWIGVLNPGTANVAAGVYNYRTSFSLDGFDPNTAILTLSVGADNRLNDILLNGVSQKISYVGFATLSASYTLRSGFRPGTNTLEFLTANDTTSPNPGGFRVNLNGSARQLSAVNTVLPGGRFTWYFRKMFLLDSLPGQSAIQLETLCADGAVVYLNGVEVLRMNMPSNSITPDTPALYQVSNPSYQGPFVLPNRNLIAGSNCLSVELHSANASSNILFDARLLLSATNMFQPPPIALAFNELAITDGGSWIELINYGDTSLDVGGCVLSRNGKSRNEYIFPSRILAPGEFLLVDHETLGFDAEPGDQWFLCRADGTGLLDAVVMKRKPQARSPDGTGRWCTPVTTTPGHTNIFQFEQNIVINEIMYHPPYSTNSEPEPTWIELHNRGTDSVNLAGWKLVQDIDYLFPANSFIEPGDFLVVADDPMLMETRYPGIRIYGSFNRKLSRGDGHIQLLDANDNWADEVHFYDRSPWPEYPDGGGSSLELLDPWSDNAKPESWSSSKDSGLTSWISYVYSAKASNVLGPTQWKEFIIGLLDAGECLIDDLSVIENPASAPAQMLQNGDFETGLNVWRTLGNHSQSRIETDPDNPGNHVLHLISTGPTGHMHNHLETTLAGGKSIVDGREYRISFRAKWLAGNNRLNTRLYFNRVARTTALPMPTRIGTPGRRNSTAVGNIGPNFTALAHDPITPKSSEPVVVSVQAFDVHGVNSIKLCWSVNGGVWSQKAMLPVTATNSDGYCVYQASIAGQPAAAIVQFYIQATDSLGATSLYPQEGIDSRALYKVADSVYAPFPLLHRLNLIMTSADASRLHAPTNVMSNQRLGATLVYDDHAVFYNVKVHLQSSERGRNDSSRVGFSVRMPAGQPYLGVHNTITLDRSGGYGGRGGKHGEILLWHLVNRVGDIPGFYSDLVYLQAPRSSENGTSLMRMSAFDGDYFDSLYPNGSDGSLYTMELIYYPTTTVNGNPQAPKLPQPDNVINVEIQNWGNDPENYRWIFIQDNHADKDDYGPLMAMNKAFSLTGTSFATQTGQLLDVDEWMRTLAFKAFTGDGDTFTYGLNHNWKIYIRPDGKALGLLWDMDFAFAQSTTYSSPGSGSPNTYRLTTLPDNYRRFSNHLYDMMNRAINRPYMDPWAKRYARLLNEDWSSAVSYLQQRADYLRGTLPLTTRFAITTQNGKDFSTTNDVINLSGLAPISLKRIEINGLDYPLTWTSRTNWTLSLPLPLYINPLAIQGIDSLGQNLTNATYSLTITNLSRQIFQPIPPKIESIVITPDQQITMIVNTMEGLNHRLDYTESLLSPLWVPLRTGLRSTNTVLNITIPLENNSQRFYRILRVGN